MPEDELIVGKIRVQCPHDEIAVVPGLLAEFVPIESIAIAVANDIEPEPCPMLTETRVGQQPIDLVHERIARLIGCEILDFIVACSQTDQIERESLETILFRNLIRTQRLDSRQGLCQESIDGVGLPMSC